MLRNTQTVLYVLVLALFLAGCVSIFGNRTPSVAVSSAGQITINGRKTELSKLAGRLKSMGVEFDDPIEISVQKDTPTTTMSEITKNLATAGYRKIMFIRPKRVISSSNTEFRSPLPGL